VVVDRSIADDPLTLLLNGAYTIDVDRSVSVYLYLLLYLHI